MGVLVDLGQDGGASGQTAHAELGGAGDIEGDDLVLDAGGHVAADAPVSPPGALALGVQVKLQGLGGGEVPVGLGGLPAQVDVEVPLGASGTDLDVVLEEESLGLLLVLGESTLPGDLGLQPVSVVEGDLGGEGVVSEGVVTTGQLLAVDLDGPLVAAASSGNLESLELLAVGLDLKQLAGVVVHGHGVLVHVAVDLVEEDGKEDVELAEQNVLLLLVDEKLELSSPLLELRQESVVV